MASSGQCLQTSERERWNGQPNLIAQDELAELSAARQLPMKIENAHVQFDARMDAENIDPRLEASPISLSVQPAARGPGYRARPGKRKSRVSSKVPIRVFSADAANFMAMVHKLTGFQSGGCLFPGTLLNPLLKPLSYPPLHPVIQGMLTPGFSDYSASNKNNTDRSPNPWLGSNFSLIPTEQLASFRNSSSSVTNKSSSMQARQPGVASSPSLWEPTTERYGRKNDSGDANKAPHDGVSYQMNCKADQGPSREA